MTLGEDKAAEPTLNYPVRIFTIMHLAFTFIRINVHYIKDVPF